jgi:hypothetical protein
MDLNLLLFVACVSSLLGASVLSYLELISEIPEEVLTALRPTRWLLLMLALLLLVGLAVQAGLVVA